MLEGYRLARRRSIYYLQSAVATYEKGINPSYHNTNFGQARTSIEMALVSTSPSPLPPFPRVAISHLDGQAKAIHHRKLQLHSLQRELIKAKDEIISAVKSDTDQTTSEVEFEFLLVLSELRLHYDSLDPEVEIVSKRQIEAGNDHPERRVPTRISYIVPSTHTMLYSVLSPLCAAIAAGSCSILEVRVPGLCPMHNVN